MSREMRAVSSGPFPIAVLASHPRQQRGCQHLDYSAHATTPSRLARSAFTAPSRTEPFHRRHHPGPRDRRHGRQRRRERSRAFARPRSAARRSSASRSCSTRRTSASRSSASASTSPSRFPGPTTERHAGAGPRARGRHHRADLRAAGGGRLSQLGGDHRRRRLAARRLSQDAHPRRPALQREVLLHARRRDDDRSTIGEVAKQASGFRVWKTRYATSAC